MEDKIISVPYIVHESSIARMERTNKRLLIALIISVLCIFATNATWIWLWNQYDYVSTDEETTLDTRDGTANYIGNDGSITYGEDTGSKED